MNYVLITRSTMTVLDYQTGHMTLKVVLSVFRCPESDDLQPRGVVGGDAEATGDCQAGWIYDTLMDLLYMTMTGNGTQAKWLSALHISKIYLHQRHSN